ncbi:MAG: hypothetical protein ACFB01_14345 [Cohaesibacteraceae bacterium]
MGIDRPFHRCVRAGAGNKYSGFSSWGYILDAGYAKSPAQYVRAYLLIQRDLERLFEYIEPSDNCLGTHSFRTHELLMRACIEVEANFKAILAENVYTPTPNKSESSNYNMTIYRKIERTHRLSSYKVSLPIWHGSAGVFRPFEAWANGGSPEWYKAYNHSKHDRLAAFKEASFESLVSAVAGLLVVLSSQFRQEDFHAGATSLSLEGLDYHEMEPAIGELFRIEFPSDWPEDEVYAFDWEALKNHPDRFQKLDYDAL